MYASGRTCGQTDIHASTLAAILRTPSRGDITATVSWPLYCVKPAERSNVYCLRVLAHEIYIAHSDQGKEASDLRTVLITIL